MRHAWLRDWWLFVRRFLHAPRSVGSIAPSSPVLVRAMLDAAEVERRQVLVELGAGTGVVTAELLRRMPTDATLLVFEIDEHFVTALRKRFADPRVRIIQASATELPKYLDHAGVDHADCIVSSLPIGSLPRDTTHAILRSIRACLDQGDVFVTYQYTPVRLGMLRASFPTMRIVGIILGNLPPALVLRCAV